MKGKKNIGNPNDDDFEMMSGSGGDLEGMAQYESYTKFEVDAKAATLKKSCTKMILSLCDIYLEALKISNEDYVKAVALVEEQNLFILMKQVQYSDHVIDSLMRQLDSGGYVDKSIYDTIRTMQKSAIQITLEISKYTRNLPEYFKFVARDAKAADSTDILLDSAKKSANSIIDITDSSVAFNPMNPQRGMREMMLEISDVRQDIERSIRNAATVEATPIAVDENDTYDDTLESDLDDDDDDE